MDLRKRQTATATPAEPGGLFDFASLAPMQGRDSGTPSLEAKSGVKPIEA